MNASKAEKGGEKNRNGFDSRQPKHDVHSWNPKRIVHWIATGLYIACVALSVFVFLMRNRKKYAGFNVLALLTLLIVASIPVWLLTIGKSAMMEMIPNGCFQIMLFVMNFVMPVKAISQADAPAEIKK